MHSIPAELLRKRIPYPPHGSAHFTNLKYISAAAKSQGEKIFYLKELPSNAQDTALKSRPYNQVDYAKVLKLLNTKKGFPFPQMTFA